MGQPPDPDVLSYDADERPRGGLLAWVAEQVRAWGPALLAVFTIRWAIAEPFRIPSGSMVPTLDIGDHILVTKFSYGLKVPFTSIEFLRTGEPARGDVVVFRYPPDPSLDYVKRLVGLPGDTIEVKHNTLYVNGQEAERSYVDSYAFSDDRCRTREAREYREDLLGAEHDLLTSAAGGPLSDFGPVTVPADHYFMMGDNRDNSADSRVWGFVPRSYLKGKAQWIWLSFDTCHGDLPVFGSIRMDRFGLRVR